MQVGIFWLYTFVKDNTWRTGHAWETAAFSTTDDLLTEQLNFHEAQNISTKMKLKSLICQLSTQYFKHKTMGKG